MSISFQGQTSPQADAIPQWGASQQLKASFFQPLSTGGFGAGAGNGGGIGWFYPGGVLAAITTSFILDEGTTYNGWLYPLDDTSGDLIATLPAASSVPGKCIHFEKAPASNLANGNKCTITANGSDPIGDSAATTYVLRNVGDRVTLVSTGSSTLGWKIIQSRQGFSGLLYSNTAASTAVAGGTSGATTGAGAAFDISYSLPVNTLKAGDKLKIKLQGTNTGGNASDTLTITLLLGSTTVIATAAVDVTDGGGDIFYAEAELVVRTIGASGTFVASGLQGLGVPGTLTAKPWFKASTTVDTTAAQVIAAKALWSSSSSSNSCRLDMLSVERIPAQPSLV